MALTPTQLQDAIIMVQDGKFGSFENRLSEYGALRAFKDNAPRLLSENTVETMKKSVRRTQKVPVLNKYNATVLDAPSCNVTGATQTSAFKSLVWAFVGFETKVTPSDYEDNYISETEGFAQQLAMGWKAVFGSLDTSAVSTLEANKSAALVESAGQNIETEAGNYAYAGEIEEMFINIPGLMMINDLNGPYNDIANSEAQATLKKIEAFGANNYFNAAGVSQMGDYRHFLTNRISPLPDREAHYICPDGSIGIYNWVDSDSRAKRVAGNKSWDTFRDPMFGFDWSIYSIEDCVDASATNGNARVYSQKAQIGAWFAFVTEYSSDTTSPIIKIVRRDQA